MEFLYLLLMVVTLNENPHSWTGCCNFPHYNENLENYCICCTEFRWSTCGVTKLFLQPIHNIITSCIHAGKSKTCGCFSSEK